MKTKVNYWNFIKKNLFWLSIFCTKASRGLPVVSTYLHSFQLHLLTFNSFNSFFTPLWHSKALSQLVLHIFKVFHLFSTNTTHFYLLLCLFKSFYSPLLLFISWTPIHFLKPYHNFYQPLLLIFECFSYLFLFLVISIVFRVLPSIFMHFQLLTTIYSHSDVFLCTILCFWASTPIYTTHTCLWAPNMF